MGPDLGAIGVPTSQELADGLAAYAGRDDLQGAALTEVLEEALLELGRQAVVQYLREQMQPLDTPGSLHYLLARLPCTLYATTAWDELLAQALAESGRRPYRAAADSELAYQPPGATLLLLLWGTLDWPNGLRLSRDEQARLPGEAPEMVFMLRKWARAGGLLFVGYRATDPALEWAVGLVQESLAQWDARAYALLPDADGRTLRRLEHQGVIGLTAPPGEVLEALVAAGAELAQPALPIAPAEPPDTATAEAALRALRRQRLLEDIAALEELLAQHQRNLRTIETTIAKYGIAPPLEWVNQRLEAERQIEAVQQELEEKGRELAGLG
ncbi:MAG: SIR2 family protein [Anaerolineae bacterium]|nr:SIR2 family protein [Anaerolineae bacterium]